MRATVTTFLTALLTFAAIDAVVPAANAQSFQGPAVNIHAAQAAQIDAWYQRYLGRCPEPGGLNYHVQMFCQGTPALVVEADILASPEYFDRNGCNDVNFVAALYRDVLNVAASPQQIHHDVRHLERMGNRVAFTQEFLQAHRGTVNVPVPVAPAPVVQTYRPVYVAPPAPPIHPLPVPPAPVYRPSYYAPPAVSVGVRGSNFGFGFAVR